MKVRQPAVMEKIIGMGDFAGRPEGMTIDTENRIYHKQYDMAYEVAGKGGGSSHYMFLVLAAQQLLSNK